MDDGPQQRHGGVIEVVDEMPGFFVALSPDGRLLACYHRDVGLKLNHLRVIDTSTGEQVKRFEPTAEEVTPGAFSPDGSLFACVIKEEERETDFGHEFIKTLRIWRTDTWKEVDEISHDNEFEQIEISRDNRYLASNGRPSALVIEMGRKKKARRVETFEVNSPGRAVAWSPDNARVFFGSNYLNENAIFNPRDASQEGTLKIPAAFENAHNGTICNAWFTSDGAALVTSFVQAVRFWDVQTGRRLRTIRIVKDGKDLEFKSWFAPDARLLAIWPDMADLPSSSASSPPPLVIIDIMTNQVNVFPGPPGFKHGTKSLAISANGRVAITEFYNGKRETLVIHDLNAIKWHALSPGADLGDGARVVITDHDITIPFLDDDGASEVEEERGYRWTGSSYIFIDDAGYVPSKRDLAKVADVLRSRGIIESDEHVALLGKITALDADVGVDSFSGQRCAEYEFTDHSEWERPVIDIKYRIAPDGPLPYFRQGCHELHAPTSARPDLVQSMEIHEAPFSMNPFVSGDEAITRFIIAHVNKVIDEEKIAENPLIQELRRDLAKALKLPLEIIKVQGFPE